MPQTPWTVPAGYYTRIDGTIVYLPGPIHTQPNAANVGTQPNVSMECLPCNPRDGG